MVSSSLEKGRLSVFTCVFIITDALLGGGAAGGVSVGDGARLV